MKKQFKRIGALALALVFALCLMLPAFADGETSGTTETNTGTITISGTTTGVKYEAYRIFDMTLKGEGEDAQVAYTVNNDWRNFFFGTDAKGADYLVEATTDNDSTYEDYGTLTDNDKVYYVNIVEENTEKNIKSNVVDFAEDALEYVVSAELKAVKSVDGAADGVTIDGLDFGYYLVYPRGASELTTNSQGSICSLDSTTPTAEVQAKATLPSITKEATNVSDGDVVGIGSEVSFKITGTVPDTTGYTSYTYKITDKMSDGLEYTENSLTVQVGETTINAGATLGNGNYTLVVEDKKELTITIDVDGMQENNIGDTITVTYTATVTAAAAKENIANSAKLTYSNNPNATGTGETGTTEEKVQLYTANIQVYAYAGKDDDTNVYKPDTALAGAEYVLSKTENDKTVYYTWDETKGTGWIEDKTKATTLKTGNDGFTGETAATAISEASAISDEESSNNTKYQASLSFKGLGEGTYTLEEITTPAGYNQATNTSFTVSANTNETSTQKVLVAEGYYIDDAYTYQIDINHKTGVELPSTGGMGTKLFYIIGAALVIGAGVVLVVRRRMGEDE
jgi:fimbrial isopeptide formation D2 family protein/LPXTG-motif cell wall-anchored protein